MEPRNIAQPSSPNAISTGVTGVFNTESYSLANFILPKQFIVDSAIAPFMAEAASNAGARNVRYGTVRPSGRGMSPTSAPTPQPIANRYSSGSASPDSTSHQYVPPARRAVMLRPVTAMARRGLNGSPAIARVSIIVTIALLPSSPGAYGSGPSPTTTPRHTTTPGTPGAAATARRLPHPR